MNWTSLTPAQVAGLWLAAAGVALWLYLHQRRPLRRTVSTLRFWVAAQVSPQPRRRLRDRWAFAAQLLFLLLAILALAGLRWGDLQESRSVAMILDTSVLSQVRPAGEPSWLERERQQALRLIDQLPARDRILLLRAEADASPLLPFTTDRVAIRRALASVRPSNGIANLPRALELGKAALASSHRGLLVYIGPGLIDDQQQVGIDDFRKTLQQTGNERGRLQFLVRLVSGPAPLDNRGIAGIALQREPTRPDLWHVLTNVKNYGAQPSLTSFKLSIDGRVISQRNLLLAPGTTSSERDAFVLSRGGLLEAEIGPADALQADNRAVVLIPSFHTVRVAVISRNPGFAGALRAVFADDPYVRAEYLRSEAAVKDKPDITIHQGEKVPAEPPANSIWFVTGSAGKGSVRVTEWNPQHPVTRWVRTHDVSIRNPASLEVQPEDTVLAAAGSAPLILARQQHARRSLIIGFDPQLSNLPQESAFPLLMAGAVEWMTSSVEDVAGSLMAGDLDLPGPPATRVLTPSNREIPFARDERGAHILARESGVYRLISQGRETALTVNTPPLPSEFWSATRLESAPPEREPVQDPVVDLWPWLVAFAMLALWAEWWLFYANPDNRRTSTEGAGSTPPRRTEAEAGQPQAADRLR